MLLFRGRVKALIESRLIHHRLLSKFSSDTETSVNVHTHKLKRPQLTRDAVEKLQKDNKVRRYSLELYFLLLSIIIAHTTFYISAYPSTYFTLSGFTYTFDIGRNEKGKAFNAGVEQRRANQEAEIVGRSPKL
jgi:hypothetical protein